MVETKIDKQTDRNNSMNSKETSDWRHQIITSDDFDEAGDEIPRESQETGIGWDDVTTPDDYLPEQS